LKIYDSATRSLRDFQPLVAGQVGIYLCGATVQGSPHIGHMRSALAFDVFARWLRRSGYEVRTVRNVTDIDDKILDKSARAGWPWWAWAYRHENEFSEAYRTLGILPPTYEPRATGHVTDMIELIARIVEAGHAYAGDPGNVYFDVASLPDYGSLTRQELANMSVDESEAEPDKRGPHDFALWKAPKPGEPATASWDSPWGRGRPGWHLECSAMAGRYLGDVFDVHGGGIDLRFPHHENEQAQSHAAGRGFARYWMHNAWVTIEGEKMSKSLGNSLTVRAVAREVPPVVLRLALGTVHYRSTVAYSPATLAEAAAVWERLSGFATRSADMVGEVRVAGQHWPVRIGADDPAGLGPLRTVAVADPTFHGRQGSGLRAEPGEAAVVLEASDQRDAPVGTSPLGEDFAYRAGWSAAGLDVEQPQPLDNFIVVADGEAGTADLVSGADREQRSPPVQSPE